MLGRSETFGEYEHLDDDSSESVSKPPLKGRVLRTSAIYACGFSMGAAEGLIGASLVYLVALLQTNLTSLSAMLSFVGLGELLACVLAGYLFEKCNHEALFGLCHCISMTAYAMAPWASNLYAYGLATLIYCISRCITETGGQPYIINIWQGGKYKDSAVHGMALATAIGSSVGPLIANPFIDTHVRDDTCNSTLTAFLSELMLTNVTTNSSSTLCQGLESDGERRSDYQKVAFGFLIVAAMGYVGPCLFLVTKPTWGACIQPTHKCVTDDSSTTDATSDSKNKILRITLYVLLLSFSLFEEWMQTIPGYYLSAFAVTELGWEHRLGSYLVTAYWGSYTGGLVACVLLAIFLNPCLMLSVALVLYTVGCLMIATLAHSSHAVVWVGVTLMGASASTVASAGWLVTERYMKVDGTVAAVIMIGSSLGLSTSYGMVSLLTSLLGTLSVVIYLLIGACIANMVILSMLTVFVKCHGPLDNGSDAGHDKADEIDIFNGKTSYQTDTSETSE